MLFILTEFIAHFHPVLVHLPIGILLLAILMQWLSQKEKYAALKEAVSIAFLAGAISAVLSCITGWLLSSGGEYDETILSLHQWMGIFVAFASVSGYLFSIQKNESLLKLVSVSILILVTITGHLGGTLTHGEGYLTKSFSSGTKDSLAVNKTITNAQEAMVYSDIIQPMLQQKCYNCHGKSKQKGGLRLDSEEFILKGGKNGAVLHAGNKDSSEIYKRVVLDPLEEKHMPPKGKPQLTEQERVLLQWWIESGSAFNKKAKELNQTVQIKAALTALEKQTVAVIKNADIPRQLVSKAADTVLAAMHKKGITILPVAENSNYLSANFVNLPRWDASAAGLLVQVKEQLLWLKIPRAKLNENEWKTIASLDHLTQLNAAHSNISDSVLAQLSPLKQLQYLNLVDTKVTVKGLLQLKGIASLKNIYLGQTRISQQDYINLKNSFPKAMIDTGGYKLEFIATDTQILRPPVMKK